MFKLVVLFGMVVLMSSVDAQRRRITTSATTEGATSEASETSGTAVAAATSAATERNLRLGDTLRQEIERRRDERQQRIEQRRENILKNLENLSDRKREFELRRQERQQNAEEMQAERRQEMEARQAGRLPEREQDRVNQLQQQRVELAVQDDALNEVDGTDLSQTIADAIRNVVLIEEANGNVRLVDLGTDEGRGLVSRVTERVEGEEEKQEVLKKLKLKLGQL